jgi:hypothetical protein
LHASNDAFFTEQLFPAPIVTDSLLPTAIGFGMAALLLVVLTRGRLGYQVSEDPLLRLHQGGLSGSG